MFIKTNRGMGMKKNRVDNGEVVVLKILVVVLICAFFYHLTIPPIVTCIFISVGYLAYEAYKK
jgi:hypothetical protein